MSRFNEMLAPELPPRELSGPEMEEFAINGVVCIRGLYSAKWLRLAEEATNAILARHSPDDRFRSDAMSWHTVDAMRDFALYGPTAHIVRQALGSARLNFFGDQIFVKRSDTSLRTPWHHDITFYPLKGDQCASVWASLDPVKRDSSALEFIAGSHLWNTRYWPIGVGGVVKSLDNLEPPPLINANRQVYKIIGWDLEPGDAILFHAKTLHSAPANISADMPRRAIATRWCGDDMVFNSNGKEMTIPWKHGLQNGDAIGGSVFPQVLPLLDAAALSARSKNAVLPDPDRIAALRAQAEQFRVVEFD